MEFIPVLALVLLTKKLLDTLKYLSNSDWNGVVTQLIAWVGGVVAVLLVSATDWADTIQVGDLNLGALNTWSLIFVGLTISSTASFVHDVTKAVDNTDSAALPTLLKK